MIEELKEIIKNKLYDYYKDNYNEQINVIVEEPKNANLGDLSVPLFAVVKTLKKPLPQLADEATLLIKESSLLIKDIKATGAYLNIELDKTAFSLEVLNKIIKEEDKYGNSEIGLNKRVVLDYSSPNIAKSFSIGHLRSTMIGNALKNILQKCGFKTTSINYLGDWGTQFGRIIVAYELWGNDKALEEDSVNYLTSLYVRFNEAAKAEPLLAEKAREAFLKIEKGEEKYLQMWKWIREESLKESQEIYDLLDVSFDSYKGESFYNDKMEAVVEELTVKGLLKEDQGAMIVDLGEDLPPALIKRRDGGSLYITRDLAAVFYRKKEYNFDKALYVVGNEQKLHFTQLKLLLEKMGYSYDLEHVNFGLYLTNGKKMSTRQGNVVKLADVLQKAISLALEQINEKNPDLENKEEIAKNIGVGAIVFADLKNHRSLDVEFDLDQSVKFEGQTGPYLQYTGVRINSIFKATTFDITKIDYTVFEKPHYFELVKLLDSFSPIIEKSAVESNSSALAKYLLSLGQSFNKFYALEKINTTEEYIKNANLALALSVRIVLNEGLRLLGIKPVIQM